MDHSFTVFFFFPGTFGGNTNTFLFCLLGVHFFPAHKDPHTDSLHCQIRSGNQCEQEKMESLRLLWGRMAAKGRGGFRACPRLQRGTSKQSEKTLKKTKCGWTGDWCVETGRMVTGNPKRHSGGGWATGGYRLSLHDPKHPACSESQRKQSEEPGSFCVWAEYRAGPCFSSWSHLSGSVVWWYQCPWLLTSMLVSTSLHVGNLQWVNTALQNQVSR